MKLRQKEYQLGGAIANEEKKNEPGLGAVYGSLLEYWTHGNESLDPVFTAKDESLSL